MNRVLLMTILMTLQISSSFAIEPVYSSFWGNAINGYDPVAYFTQNKPVEGKKSFSFEWNEATWLFSSQENLELFKKSPEKYAPQYGGYCAWAVSQGYTAKIDPFAWKIYEGKLYLNYNKAVQKTWEQDIPKNITKADKNWPELLQ